MLSKKYWANSEMQNPHGGMNRRTPPWQGEPLSCGLLQPGRFGDVSRCWPEGHRLPEVCASPGCWQSRDVGCRDTQTVSLPVSHQLLCPQNLLSLRQPGSGVGTGKPPPAAVCPWERTQAPGRGSAKPAVPHALGTGSAGAAQAAFPAPPQAPLSPRVPQLCLHCPGVR